MIMFLFNSCSSDIGIDVNALIFPEMTIGVGCFTMSFFIVSPPVPGAAPSKW